MCACTPFQDQPDDSRWRTPRVKLLDTSPSPRHSCQRDSCNVHKPNESGLQYQYQNCSSFIKQNIKQSDIPLHRVCRRLYSKDVHSLPVFPVCVSCIFMPVHLLQTSDVLPVCFSQDDIQGEPRVHGKWPFGSNLQSDDKFPAALILFTNAWPVDFDWMTLPVVVSSVVRIYVSTTPRSLRSIYQPSALSHSSQPLIKVVKLKTYQGDHFPNIPPCLCYSLYLILLGLMAMQSFRALHITDTFRLRG